MKKLLCLAILAISLSSCSWLQDVGESVGVVTDRAPSTVALAKAGLGPAITGEVAYNKLPLCGTVAPGVLCKDYATTRKMKDMRIAAHDALNAAEEAANTAKDATDKAKVQDLIGAANTAVDAFKQFVGIFAPPAVTTKATN